MNLRILLGSVCVVVLACSSRPPPIGSNDDAGTEAGGGDATADAPSDAAGDGGEGGSCTLGSPPSPQACASCVQAAPGCCDAWNACQGSADCLSYVACVRPCYPPQLDGGALDAGNDGGLPPPIDGGEGGGFACAKACQQQYPNGVNTGIVVVDCLDTQCVSACN